MLVSIIDEFGNYEKIIGQIDDTILNEVVSAAAILNFKCIAYISLECDTIFNQLQIQEIKKEIKVLFNYSVNKEVLAVFDHASLMGLLEDYLYLKFEPHPALEMMNGSDIFVMKFMNRSKS